MTTLIVEAGVTSPVASKLRPWAIAGIVAVVGGVGGVAFFDTERSLATQDVRLRLCAGLGMIGVAGLVTFISGLRRHLDAQTPPGSLTGRLALIGGQTTAVTLFVTYLLKLTVSENVHRITGAADVVVRNALDELTTGAWAGLALVMFAVAVAALRRAAFPRWLGWLSAVVCVIVSAVTVTGAPAGAYLPSMLWLLVMSVALARGSTR